MKQLLITFIAVLLLPFPALAQQPGEKIWEFHTGGINATPAIGPDGTIYVAGELPTFRAAERGYLYALSPAGTMKWKITTVDPIQAAPSVGLDAAIHFVTDNTLTQLDPGGKITWKRVLGDLFGAIFAAPTVSLDGTLYCASSDGTLYARKPDGTRFWTFLTQDDIHSSPAIASDRTIYFGSNDNRLYAVQPNGRKKWEYQAAHNIVSSPAVDLDGTVYFASWDGTLYAVTPDGQAKWSFKAPGQIDSSPVIGSKGVIYFSTHAENISQNQFNPTFAGRLFALSRDGKKIWEQLLEDGEWEASSVIPYSSPAVAEAKTFPGEDSRIYVASGTGKLHAFTSSGAKAWDFQGYSDEYLIYGVEPPTIPGDPTPEATKNVLASPVVSADGTVYFSTIRKIYAVFGGPGPSRGPWPKMLRDLRNSASGQTPTSDAAFVKYQSLPDKKFRLIASCPPGKNYTLSFSTNLLNWGTGSRLSSVNGILTFNEQPQPASFYRLKEENE